jgi:hypothetical protein
VDILNTLLVVVSCSCDDIRSDVKAVAVFAQASIKARQLDRTKLAILIGFLIHRNCSNLNQFQEWIQSLFADYEHDENDLNVAINVFENSIATWPMYIVKVCQVSAIL